MRLYHHDLPINVPQQFYLDFKAEIQCMGKKWDDLLNEWQYWMKENNMSDPAENQRVQTHVHTPGRDHRNHRPH